MDIILFSIPAFSFVLIAALTLSFFDKQKRWHQNSVLALTVASFVLLLVVSVEAINMVANMWGM